MKTSDVHNPSPLYETYVESHVGRLAEISWDSLEKSRQIYRKLFSRFLPRNRDSKILDVGCGHGSFVHFLQRAGYTNVTGIDISGSQLDLARKLGISGVEMADASSYLQNRVDEFDLITAIDSLEHLKKEDALGFVSAVFRSLAPGGKFFIRVPNAASPWFGRYRYGDFTHELAYTQSSLRQILISSGFKNVAFFSAGPVVHGIASAVRWVLWRMIELGLRVALLAETGEFRNQIFTQNLIAIAEKSDF